jgi:hypothetical protein
MDPLFKRLNETLCSRLNGQIDKVCINLLGKVEAKIKGLAQTIKE